jgi:hypothetical protein
MLQCETCPHIRCFLPLEVIMAPVYWLLVSAALRVLGVAIDYPRYWIQMYVYYYFLI